MATYLIREMPEGDRPRERLRERGERALSDAELIAILLRTGMKGESAVQLAQRMLKTHGNSLHMLKMLPLAELAKIKGVGMTKAIQLKAAFDLARRLSEHESKALPVATPEAAASVLREEFRGLDREQFMVLLLSTKNTIIKRVKVSEGTLNASLVEPRETFKEAFTNSAAAIILAHNHPSGDPTPSSEDIAITKKLVKAGELLNINVLDHIIIGQRTQGRAQDYVSLKELGLM